MISLIALIQTLPNILPAACIFSYPIMTYLKMLHGDMSLNTQQCPAGLSSRIIPQVSLLLQKMSPPSMFLGCTHQMLTVAPSHEPLWEILWMGKNPNQQLRIYWFPPLEKSPLIDFHLLLSKVSFLPNQIAIFM